jgi:hypothetical protein
MSVPFNLSINGDYKPKCKKRETKAGEKIKKCKKRLAMPGRLIYNLYRYIDKSL